MSGAALATSDEEGGPEVDDLKVSPGSSTQKPIEGIVNGSTIAPAVGGAGPGNVRVPVPIARTSAAPKSRGGIHGVAATGAAHPIGETGCGGVTTDASRITTSAVSRGVPARGN